METANKLSLDWATKRMTAVSDKIETTLLFLLEAYDRGKKRFCSSIREESRVVSPSNNRDTAIVLAAIEAIARDFMDAGPPLPVASANGNVIARQDTEMSSLTKEIEASRDPDSKKARISRVGYLDRVFRPCLSEICTAADSLGATAGVEDKEVLETANCLNCAAILRAINTFHDTESYCGPIFIKALDQILDALCKLRPPHYAFGGASLTTRPNGFVSYFCLRSLVGVRKNLEVRWREYEAVANLLKEMLRWCDNDRGIRILYGDNWGRFKAHIEDVLSELPQAVGLEPVTRTIYSLCNGSEPNDTVLAQAIVGGLSDDAPDNAASGSTASVNQLPGMEKALKSGALERDVEKKIVEIENSINAIHKKIEQEIAHAATHPGRGAHSLDRAKDYLQLAGLRWKQAFFDGMLHSVGALKQRFCALRNIPLGNPKEVVDKTQMEIRAMAQEWRASAELTQSYISKFSKWAAGEVNRQIALYSLPSRPNFDPVQLAFSLRIYNDIDTEKNPQLIRQALAIALECQHPDGTWPAGDPFVLSSKSRSLGVHVANLEIINALMPLIQIMGGIPHYNENLERIFQWLILNERSITERTAKPRIFGGWAHDKMAQHSRIDIWMTALATEFLFSYRELLQEYVISQTKTSYTFSKPSRTWVEIVDPQLASSSPKSPGTGSQASEGGADRPEDQLVDDRVTSKIYRGYIEPFKTRGHSDKSAMLLYGPPGTSKTTIAEAIANELGWNFVTITPSDFIKDGIERSEYYAREIFRDLNYLSNTVVLFDEIDEMLRSRADTDRPQGIAMLQFLIPGMLPKLQQLKHYGERARLIFIIATNYQERLDKAIRRKGRIDDEFLILPPDTASREYHLFQMLTKRGLFCNYLERLRSARVLADLTPGWVYKELQQLVSALEHDVFRNQSDTAGEERAQRKIAQLENTKPTEEEIKQERLRGREILGLTRDLDLGLLYRGRPAARDEARQVLKVCRPMLEDQSFETELEAILSPLPSNEPTAQRIGPKSVADVSKNENRTTQPGF